VLAVPINLGALRSGYTSVSEATPARFPVENSRLPRKPERFPRPSHWRTGFIYAIKKKKLPRFSSNLKDLRVASLAQGRIRAGLFKLRGLAEKKLGSAAHHRRRRRLPVGRLGIVTEKMGHERHDDQKTETRDRVSGRASTVAPKKNTKKKNHRRGAIWPNSIVVLSSLARRPGASNLALRPGEALRRAFSVTFRASSGKNDFDGGWGMALLTIFNSNPQKTVHDSTRSVQAPRISERNFSRLAMRLGLAKGRARPPFFAPLVGGRTTYPLRGLQDRLAFETFRGPVKTGRKKKWSSR